MRKVDVVHHTHRVNKEALSSQHILLREGVRNLRLVWPECRKCLENVSIGTYTGHLEKLWYIFETLATPLASSLILLLDPPHRASKLLTLVLPTYIKVAYLSKEVVVLIFLM